MLTITYLTRDDTLLTKTEVSGGWNKEALTGVIYITEATYARLKGQTPLTVEHETKTLLEAGFASVNILKS